MTLPMPRCASVSCPAYDAQTFHQGRGKQEGYAHPGPDDFPFPIPLVNTGPAGSSTRLRGVSKFCIVASDAITGRDSNLFWLS